VWDAILFLRCVVLNMWLIVKTWNAICDWILGQLMLRVECWNDANYAKVEPCYTYIVVISILLLYLSYLYAFVYLYLLKNVMTHSSCVACVWILWWSWTLYSWEQMTRWIVLRNFVLKDARTQCFDRMWHWGMSFYFNSRMFRTCYFILFYSTT